MKKRIIPLLIASCMLFNISGCGILLDDPSQQKEIIDSSMLTTDTYYVMSEEDKSHEIDTETSTEFPTEEKGTDEVSESLKSDTEDTESSSKNYVYNPTYLYNYTFENSEQDYSQTGDPTRLVWNTNKQDKNIPTLYSGDKLILYSEDTLPTTFSFERFKDMGYSVGIAGLTKTENNKFLYSFDTEEIMPDSDADRINDYANTTDYVLFDKLGGKEIKPENVSKSGIILGLKKNASYEADIYCGTVETKMNLTANIHIYEAFEAFESYDFHTLDENTIEITIPEYLKTGYYVINGSGMFRYIAKGDTYNKSTDFNDPIIDVDKDGIVLYDPSRPEDYSTEEISEEETEVSPDNNKNTDGEDVLSASYDYTVKEDEDEVAFIVNYSKAKTTDFSTTPYMIITSPSGEKTTVIGESKKIARYMDDPEPGKWKIDVYNAQERKINFVTE